VPFGFAVEDTYGFKGYRQINKKITYLSFFYVILPINLTIMSKQTFLFLGFDKKSTKFIKPLLNNKVVDYTFSNNYNKGLELNLIVINAENENSCHFLEEIKSDKKNKNTNVLLYTSIDEKHILNCYKMGISDFIDKNLPESIIKAKLMHYVDCRKRNKKSSSKIKIGNLTVNIKKRKVTRKGVEVNLTKTEYDILSLLTTDQSKIYSRDEIYQYVWGKTIVVGERTLDVHMNNLRKKIGKSKIRTRKGIGFMINTEL
jgi:two-component system alkaline phosphatase synthesis response regulator PhoP